MTNGYLLLCNTTFAKTKFKTPFEKTQANKTNKYLHPLFTQSNTKMCKRCSLELFGMDSIL
jgi:hypothetical protein